MKEVVRAEVIKWLDAGIIYPISDSAWVSPVQVVPKKGGVTVAENEDNELIPTRPVTGWRVCIDYRKLNKATRKGHFPLPFIDQMLERLTGYSHYWALNLMQLLIKRMEFYSQLSIICFFILEIQHRAQGVSKGFGKALGKIIANLQKKLLISCVSIIVFIAFSFMWPMNECVS
ncbi:uncharacterized protein LOC111372235 [Olea europaea var. sylvestris]|uniref:uncharacterized protein LOC111372235 n=1 Tax=Olea europaea var. sylvestris TaxID=158386 RepID=UPI000C1D04D5|nr:uncharacterized protein LOC111372235 [Olea europaea var. sylvestris]